MTFSIIITCKDYLEAHECIRACDRLNHFNYELLVMTGDDPPGIKRDSASKIARGDILAFLDSDAYPDAEWLNEAEKVFNGDIGAVCGPGVTPPTDNLRQKASGLIYALSPYKYRYFPCKARDVEDFPSCNLFVRKSLFNKIGGFSTPHWPGEDTLLCLKIIAEGKRVVYHPAVLVYHHRRELFKKHLAQVLRYAKMRGYFAKKHPRTSLQILYVLPTLFFLITLGIVLNYLIYGLFFLIGVFK